MKKRNAKLKEDLKQLKLETAAQSSLMDKQLFAENEYSNRNEKDELKELDYNISSLKYKTKMEKSRHEAIMDHLNNNISSTSTHNTQWNEYAKSLLSSKQEEIKVRFQLQIRSFGFRILAIYLPTLLVEAFPEGRDGRSALCIGREDQRGAFQEACSRGRRADPSRRGTSSPDHA